MENYVQAAGSLQPEWCTLPGRIRLLCDTSLAPSAPRPIVPSSMVKLVLPTGHGLAHAGGNALLRDLSRRFVWRGMAKDVKDYARSCLSCQKSKITRHTRSPLAPLEMPDRRFAAIHLDLVGPLPESEGFSYMLTVIDRYSRWLEAIPLSDISAKTCAKALLRHWVARFGTPDSIVTDRGRQFTSDLWAELLLLLGVSKNLTTAYHPQANGMIERQHRTLKGRLIARACASGTSDWMTHLPFVLLGICTSIRADSSCSPSDLLYGAPLRLPGDLFGASPASSSASEFAKHLKAVMRQASPMPVLHHGVPDSRVDPRLLTASHVFLRIDAVKRPLVPPYEGPFQVLERSTNQKTFVVLRRDKPVTVTG